MGLAKLHLVLCVTVPALCLGCLSNSYVVPHDELTRLAAVDPGDRWPSVRAVQRVGGDDFAPQGDVMPPPPDEPIHGVYVGTVVVHSHHNHGTPPPPPRGPHAQGRLYATNAGTGGTSGVTTSASPKKGNGDSAAALAVAAAVVVGTATAFAAVGSEGARYDGWVATNPDEPLHLELPDGQTKTVALSMLAPEDAAAAQDAIVYEGESGRFPRLARAPLDRAGFTMTTALHMAGIPQFENRVASGMGGYLHLGGNIANLVTLGMSATADGGLDAKRSVLLATVGPEVQIFPIRFAGVYGGAGWSFRNTQVDDRTRADAGHFFRAGLVGELTLTTRLALQLRAGIIDEFFPTDTRLSAEGQLGVAIY